MTDTVTQFYYDQLPEAELKNNILQAPCPFCTANANGKTGKLIVVLNQQSFFHGYFRCLNRCIPGGFPLYFARQRGIDLRLVPGYDPDRDYPDAPADYPIKNINSELLDYREKLTDELVADFAQSGIDQDVLAEIQIGYNGRYLVYPYIQNDGNCYSAHCIHPARPADTFWYGDENFFTDHWKIYNVGEIDRCENGSLVIVEGEKNLLTIKQLGLPVIAVPRATDLAHLDTERLTWLRTIFLWVNHTPEANAAAKAFATRVGYKIRVIRWPESAPKDASLIQLARDRQDDFRNTALQLIKEATAFSPFPSPEGEYIRFREQLDLESGASYRSLRSGFPLLDQALGGIHGINIVGGTPKAGKSCFFIQIATQMAAQKIPVIYYDFENGRQKIYHRTLCRTSRLTTEEMQQENLDSDKKKRLQDGREAVQSLLPWFRIVTDRAVTPTVMRRHIDFLRHETNSPYTVVIIDSLHKLPFKDFSERRTGIDAWLRQFEAIRDELNVSFLVISELTRGKDGQYDSQPHLGSFKGSGDIEYSADNAMVLLPGWDPFDNTPAEKRTNDLWLVASREQSPGRIGQYRLDYPYWGFIEETE